MPVSMCAILDSTRAALREFEMTPSDARPVLVATSGGPDSTALAHVLSELRVPICIAHFDHQTRGGGSAEDAAFVKDLAGELRVPFYATGRGIEAEAAESSMSFDEYAREARYAFLVETAKAEGCGAIATGHHADDQAETVLMRVLRGTGPRGLAGIPSKGERDGVPLIRPLMRLRRADILAYLDDRGHAYCHDESNFDIGYARNRVRHELLPQLRHEYNPRLHDALCRLAETQRTEDELLASLTRDVLAACRNSGDGLSRESFRAAHRALQRRAVLEVARQYGVEPKFDHVERAIRFIDEAATGKSFDLGRGVRLRSRARTIEVVSGPRAPVDAHEVALEVPGVTEAFGKHFRLRPLDRPPAEPLAAYCTPSRQVVDASALAPGTVVRHRRNGDRIAPYGLRGTRKLKDYFCDMGVSPAERDEKLLVTTNNEIVWVVGHAVSARAAVTDATTSMMEIEVADDAQ